MIGVVLTQQRQEGGFFVPEATVNKMDFDKYHSGLGRVAFKIFHYT